MRSAVTILLALVLFGVSSGEFFVPPFYRQLAPSKATPSSGADVYVLQHFLVRGGFAREVTKVYDEATARGVLAFQRRTGLNETGIVDPETARAVIESLGRDFYRDDLSAPLPDGVLYKVHIPVFLNRTMETHATLYDRNMRPLHKFRVGTRGQTDAEGEDLNQFSHNGYTPTGLWRIDLNSPEGDAKEYGPWPVNRLVEGLAGNAAFLATEKTSGMYIRDGLLMHTGEWAGWKPWDELPRSHGCIHAPPEDIHKVWQILVKIGVEVRKNPFTSRHYPFKPQGLMSIELVDEIGA